MTKATTKAPAWLASLATTGAAPEPVPPPRPTHMKTRDFPSTAARISSIASFAASAPRSGSPPAPRPWVRSFPICILSLATEVFNARRSVLRVSNCASSIPSSAMRSRTLEPAPPIPITFTCPGANTDFSPSAGLRSYSSISQYVFVVQD